MAQIDFYFNRLEKKKLLVFLLENGCKLVPDEHLDSPSYKICESVEDLEFFLDENVIFFITHKNYTIAPLVMDDFDKEGSVKYYISQKYGGPAMSMYLNGIAEKEGNYAINFLLIYPFYMINCEKVQASESLKAFYKKILLYIKRCSKVFHYSKRSVWIGNNNNQNEIASKLYK